MTSLFHFPEKLLTECEHVVPRIWVRDIEGEDPADSDDSLPIMARDRKRESRKEKTTVLLRWHPAFVELLERINGECLKSYTKTRTTHRSFDME